MKRNTNPNQLLDTFQMSGSDKFSFAKVIGYQTDNTRTRTVRGSQVCFYCITSDGVKQVLKQCPADPMKSGSGRFVALDALRQKGNAPANWPIELWDEAITQSKIFIGVIDDSGNQTLMPVSKEIYSDFAVVGVTGTAATTASYHLLGLIAEQIEDSYITLVTRIQPSKKGDIEKVITMRSSGYAYIPQDEALDLASKVCDDGDIIYWNVSNFLTEAVYEFSKSAVHTTYGRKNGHFVPYIRYTNSDAGDSSCAFELGWDVNGNTVFLASGTNRAFRQHRGEWNQAMHDSLYADAIKLKDKFTILADRMKELDTITVLNENIERVVKNLCSDAKITGKGKQEAFVQYVTDEFTGTDASAAEIVLAMIEAQNNVQALLDLSDIQRSELQHKLGEIPYQRIRQHA